MMEVSLDENQFASHELSPRKRKLKRDSTHKKTKGQRRQPLADASVKENSVTTPCSTVVSAETCEDYCDVLRNSSSKELYAALMRDVLSKAPVGTSVDKLKELVADYLKTHDQEAPQTRKKNKRRISRVDQEVIAAGFFASPSPRKDVVVLRRSLRLRNSLHSDNASLVDKRKISKLDSRKDTGSSTECHKTKLDLSTCSSIGESDTCTYSNELALDQPANEDEKAIYDAETLTTFSDVQTMADTESLSHEECLLEEEDNSPNLNTTFTIIDTEDSREDGESEWEITPYIESLYKNRVHFVKPDPKTFSTIYEEPKICRGYEIIFSKTQEYRSFNFCDGCWYHVPETKLKQRVSKGKKNGWRKSRYPTVTDEVVKAALEKLEITMAGFS
ncbi:uncharacterized protein [Watersipora subatra]|uniref:uncharacterized protein n=1 Tax=Watersipora subatra TaxID=2589382 RepID=UPI00355B099E